MKKKFILMAMALTASSAFAQTFKINDRGYFSCSGSDVMVFSDQYPEGHAGGITVIQQDNRMAALGDVRFEASPGQWQGLPKLIKKEVNREANEICVTLAYPDSSKHAAGFNPMFYTDFQFTYKVRVKGVGDNLDIRVEIDKPVPAKFAGKLGFNLELQPSQLYGMPFLMDNKAGQFPHQAMGPTMHHESSNADHLGDYFQADITQRWGDRVFTQHRDKANIPQLLGDGSVYNPYRADDIISAPLAEGKHFVLQPHAANRVDVECQLGTLRLYDGRMNHQNGWFVLRTEFAAGAQGEVAHWTMRPNIDATWMYTPVVQTSQFGYHPDQKKFAVIELDMRDKSFATATLQRITEKGIETIKQGLADEWGNFNRYHYLVYDFTDVKEPGLYQVKYGNETSPMFRIAEDIFDQGIWQAEIEYFLPVQMCHMRVNDKYRCWHDVCHMDDAVMAPTGFNYIDGYVQGASTLTKYKSGEEIPGMAVGGWHDAGDWDLRVESQSIQPWQLTMMVENLGAYWDETTIDQQRHLVEIHQPDGVNDYLQQIEHGALSLMAGWRAMGRLYRGVICPTVRQYVFLGDAGSHTDRVKGTEDDRWVFTEENPFREFDVAGRLAAISRVMKGYNDTLSVECLNAAKTIYAGLASQENPAVTNNRLLAAAELWLTTRDKQYCDYILSQKAYICEHIDQCGWFLGRFDKAFGNKKFSADVQKALLTILPKLDQMMKMNPYRVSNGRGGFSSGSWAAQHEGFHYAMLHDAYPEIFSTEYMANVVEWALGMHPGRNRSSFVGGIGQQAARITYGANRADWSYIPGAVIPGTNTIQPDLPELLEFPFLWQQREFCVDGANTAYHYTVMSLAKSYRK